MTNKSTTSYIEKILDEYKNEDKYNSKDTLLFKYEISKYENLIGVLIENNISPEEAQNLILKNKFETNARYFWTIERIIIYLFFRWIELSVFMYDHLNKKILDNHSDYAIRYPGQSEKDHLKKMSKFFNEPINYKVIIQGKKNGKIFKKRVDTCRDVVDSEEFSQGFKTYNKTKKFDSRLEVQNLQKLVSEKKHNEKFLIMKWVMYDKSTDKNIRNAYLKGKETKSMGLYRVFKECLNQKTINFLK